MKILLYDVENSPNVVYTWPGSMYEQNVIKVHKNWELLSIAYKWLGDKKTHCLTKQGKKSDKEMVQRFVEVLNEADVVIAHNAIQFDNKKIRSKCLEHGIKPPAPFRTIDTLQVSRSKFSLNSNKLDELAKLLGLGSKLKHQGFDLWLGCMADDKQCWKTMAKYNVHDVVLLEKVYLKLRPWITNHPHVAFANGLEEGCGACGSKNLRSNGFRHSNSATYRRFQCLSCGYWNREKVNISKIKNRSASL